MRYINYTSDFEFHQKLDTTAPFELTYYIQGKEQRLVASYDGRKYTNCIPDGGGIIVPVDYTKVQLGIGRIRCTARYYLNNEHFSGGVCEAVSDLEVGIELHRGASDDMGDLVATPLPSYHIVYSEGGGGGYQPPVGGIPREDLADDVQTSLGKADTALQEHQDLTEYAKKSELPTKTSQLTNDSGYITEGRVEEMIEDKVTSANVTNIVSITQADYDALETKSETTLYLITE